MIKPSISTDELYIKARKMLIRSAGEPYFPAAVAYARLAWPFLPDWPEAYLLLKYIEWSYELNKQRLEEVEENSDCR